MRAHRCLANAAIRTIEKGTDSVKTENFPPAAMRNASWLGLETEA